MTSPCAALYAAAGVNAMHSDAVANAIGFCIFIITTNKLLPPKDDGLNTTHGADD